VLKRRKLLREATRIILRLARAGIKASGTVRFTFTGPSKKRAR
jgi:hypothetical protein